MSTAAERFTFAWDPRYVRAAKPFGVRPDRAWVDVGTEDVTARFGPWRCRTPLDNVVAVDVTGPYRFLKTAGSARLGITDLGLTFASNGERGVLLTFARRVPGIERVGLLRHGELTVTVQEIDRFAALVRERAGLDPS